MPPHPTAANPVARAHNSENDMITPVEVQVSLLTAALYTYLGFKVVRIEKFCER